MPKKKSKKKAPKPIDAYFPKPSDASAARVSDEEDHIKWINSFNMTLKDETTKTMVRAGVSAVVADRLVRDPAMVYTPNYEGKEINSFEVIKQICKRDRFMQPREFAILEMCRLLCVCFQLEKDEPSIDNTTPEGFLHEFESRYVGMGSRLYELLRPHVPVDSMLQYMFTLAESEHMAMSHISLLSVIHFIYYYQSKHNRNIINTMF